MSAVQIRTRRQTEQDNSTRKDAPSSARQNLDDKGPWSIKICERLGDVCRSQPLGSEAVPRAQQNVPEVVLLELMVFLHLQPEQTWH